MDLIIDRITWLRGEGSAGSRLLRPRDDKQCCLGFYLRAIGHDEATIHDEDSPSNLTCPVIIAPGGTELGDWLIDNTGADSPDGRDLMSLNDARLGEGEIGVGDWLIDTEATREARIAEIFARHDITVRFIN